MGRLFLSTSFLCAQRALRVFSFSPTVIAFPVVLSKETGSVTEMPAAKHGYFCEYAIPAKLIRHTKQPRDMIICDRLAVRAVLVCVVSKFVLLRGYFRP